jgi:hypothetical protein
MKPIFLHFLFSLILVIVFSSCKKQLIEKYEDTKSSAVVKSTKDIKAPSNFNWNIANTVSFRFTGKIGDARKSTLKIYNSIDNTVLFKKLQSASESYKDVIELPAYVNKITVVYDGTSNNYTLNTNNFDISLK